jgi:hypothetical protein
MFDQSVWIVRTLARRQWPLFIAAVACLPPPIAAARVKLITLPVRERVEIQLDNASATLVEEERNVPLVKGENQLDFAWSGMPIDAGTILLRILKPPDAVAWDVKVISVSTPPGETALVWTVWSERSGPVRVRISYLLGQLTKSFNYRAVANKDERTLTLSQYIRVQNLANEEFAASGVWAGFGPRFFKPIGLNETKEMLVERVTGVPIRKTYTCNPAEFDYLDRAQNKLRVPMHYVLKNDAAGRLGSAAMPAGKVRIFQDDGADGTAFLGEDMGRFTPRDDELRLYLGVAQDIVVKRTIERNQRIDAAGNLHHYDALVKYEIENFKDSPVTLDVIENLRHLRNELRGDSGRDVQWELGKETSFSGGPDRERSTFEQITFHADLPARRGEGKAEKIIHKLHVLIRNEW